MPRVVYTRKDSSYPEAGKRLDFNFVRRRYLYVESFRRGFERCLKQTRLLVSKGQGPVISGKISIEKKKRNKKKIII